MDPRLFFPATARNRAPILSALRERLPARGTVVEVACGSGEHAAFFAANLPGLLWLPTDAEPAHVASADAWTHAEALSNVLPARRLTLGVDPWPTGPVAAVYCANLVHIAPWEVTLALMDGAARVLAPGAPLLLYGPYRIDGQHTADSNAAFDASLKARDPRWGVRDVADVLTAADGFTLAERVVMPANNQILVLRRT